MGPRHHIEGAPGPGHRSQQQQWSSQIRQRAPKIRHQLQGYAHDLGLAFQITDDLLDIDGNSEETGKATQKDAERGKATFVSLMGADRARNQAELLAGQAIEHLEVFGEKALLLRALAQYVLDRRK